MVQAYSGLRAKLSPPGQKGGRDFIITRDPDLSFCSAIDWDGIASADLVSRDRGTCGWFNSRNSLVFLSSADSLGTRGIFRCCSVQS